MDKAGFLQSIKEGTRDAPFTAVVSLAEAISNANYSFSNEKDLAPNAPLGRLKAYFQSFSDFKFEDVPADAVLGIMVTAPLASWKKALNAKSYPVGRLDVQYYHDDVEVHL